MFEHHREHQAEAARRDWQAHHDAYVALLDTARTFTGTTADGLLLGPGETLYLQVADTALIEERRGPGTYTGHSQGISVPVVRVGGRQIRYRVGATRGHYVQGQPAPTAVDTGTTFITSTRVVFRGSRQTRTCAFAKLLGYDADGARGSVTLSVANRSTPTTIQYGPACAATVEFRLDLALAHFRGTVDDLVAGLEADLEAIDATRPADGAPGAVPPVAPVAPPPPATGSVPPTPSTTPAPTTSGAGSGATAVPDDPGPGSVAVPAGWYPDPWRSAPLRWWDGSAWSWQTVDPAAPPQPPG